MKLIFFFLTILWAFHGYAQNDTIYFDDHSIKGIGQTIDGQKTNKWIFFYASGQIESEGCFIQDKKNGDWKWYYQNGQQMSLEKYDNGKFQGGKFWNEAGEGVTLNEILVHPSYPNGGMDGLMQFISSEIHYPDSALNLGIQGQVIIDFNVNKNGEPVDLKVYKSIDESLDNEALRVIKASGTWIPGTFHGEKCKIAMRIPINFVL